MWWFLFYFVIITSNERRGRGVTSGDRDTKSQQTKQLDADANCLVGVRISKMSWTQEKSQFF